MACVITTPEGMILLRPLLLLFYSPWIRDKTFICDRLINLGDVWFLMDSIISSQDVTDVRLPGAIFYPYPETVNFFRDIRHWLAMVQLTTVRHLITLARH